MASITDRIVQMAQALVTQGAADAFVTAQIATGISTAAKYGWMLERVEFGVNQAIVAAPQTADCDFQCQIGQGVAPASIYPASSADLICERRVAIPGIAAAVNAYPLELYWTWRAPENYVIVDPTLNVVLDSTNTAVANSMICRVYYYPIQLQELDILRLISLR